MLPSMTPLRHHALRPTGAALIDVSSRQVRARSRPWGIVTVPEARTAAAYRAEASAGPGSGRRRYPEVKQPFEGQPRNKGRASPWACKTTAECYEEFPYAVRSSFPLRVDDSEPAGLSAQHVPDAGPASGRRRRPAAVDAEALRHPAPLPHPAASRDLKKERMLRLEIVP